MKNPNLYIIAGPNGAGKTTFARKFLPLYAKCDRFVNADSLASGLSLSPQQAALRAGRLLLDEIHRLSKEKQDFGFETTLSGKAYVSFLTRLKSQDYSIHLFFLWIPDIKLSLARIAERVKRGGHDIPEKWFAAVFTRD
jgi:predicted ABC-type ATPase